MSCSIIDLNADEVNNVSGGVTFSRRMLFSIGGTVAVVGVYCCYLAPVAVASTVAIGASIVYVLYRLYRKHMPYYNGYDQVSEGTLAAMNHRLQGRIQHKPR